MDLLPLSARRVTCRGSCKTRSSQNPDAARKRIGASQALDHARPPRLCLRYLEENAPNAVPLVRRWRDFLSTRGTSISRERKSSSAPAWSTFWKIRRQLNEECKTCAGCCRRLSHQLRNECSVGVPVARAFARSTACLTSTTSGPPSENRGAKNTNGDPRAASIHTNST